jgi:hypothetical protein
VTTEEFAIITEKLDRLARRAPFEHVLWDTRDVADHLKLEYSTVRDKIITRPTFPRPVRKASGRAPAIFKAIEVVAWGENNPL